MKVLEKREKEVEKREQEWAQTVAMMEMHANNQKNKIILDVGLFSFVLFCFPTLPLYFLFYISKNESLQMFLSIFLPFILFPSTNCDGNAGLERPSFSLFCFHLLSVQERTRFTPPLMTDLFHFFSLPFFQQEERDSRQQKRH